MTETETVHASAVALDDSGLLIIGPAGSGKSSLAIEMIAMGAELIGDDMVALSAKGGEIFAAAASGARGQIEARVIIAGRGHAKPLPGNAMLVLQAGVPHLHQRYITR